MSIACRITLVMLAATVSSPALAQEKIPVVQWDQFAATGITAAGPAMEALINACEAKLPNLDVQRTVVPSIGIRETYRLAVSANETPDLAYTWPAAAVLSGYARNGRLAKLDGYYDQYKWAGINAFYRGRNSYQGSLYGVPMEQDLMGVYYNKTIFAELGLSVPKTFAEFEAAADKIKEGGYTPIAFGNRDRWPATNTLSLLFGLSAGRQAEEEVLFRDGKWTDAPFVKAATTLKDWTAKGYFPRGFNGVGYDEANALFLGGRAAMTITGTWVLQDIARGAKFDLGVFMLPPIGEGIPAGTMWGEGSQWQIAEKSAQPVKDAAAAYVDCLLAPENRKTWGEKGFLVPIGSTAEEIQGWNVLPVVKEFFAAGLATPDTNFYDLHTTLPESVTQVLYSELQRLTGGQSEPSEFLAALQTSWETAKANNERWVP